MKVVTKLSVPGALGMQGWGLAGISFPHSGDGRGSLRAKFTEGTISMMMEYQTACVCQLAAFSGERPGDEMRCLSAGSSRPT